MLIECWLRDLLYFIAYCVISKDILIFYRQDLKRTLNLLFSNFFDRNLRRNYPFLDIVPLRWLAGFISANNISLEMSVYRKCTTVRILIIVAIDSMQTIGKLIFNENGLDFYF